MASQMSVIIKIKGTSDSKDSMWPSSPGSRFIYSSIAREAVDLILLCFRSFMEPSKATPEDQCQDGRDLKHKADQAKRHGHFGELPPNLG